MARSSRSASASAAARLGASWPSRAATASSTGPSAGRRTSAASASTEARSAQCTSSRHNTSGRVSASRPSRSRSALCVRWRSAGHRRPAELGERRERGAQRGGVGQSKPRPLALAQTRHVIVQGFGPEGERQIRLELRGPRAQHDAPPLHCGISQVSEQPRLADSRLALDRHEPPCPAPSVSSNPAIASRSAARPTSPVIAADATSGRPPVAVR